MKTPKHCISKVASPLAEALQQTSARKRARHTLQKRGMTLLRKAGIPGEYSVRETLTVFKG
jgi:hypothetical protein